MTREVCRGSTKSTAEPTEVSRGHSTRLRYRSLGRTESRARNGGVRLDEYVETAEAPLGLLYGR